MGILYQLHYTNLIFFPIVGLASLFLFPKKTWLIQWATLILGFILGDAPFLIFEIKHGFPNTKTVWEFVTRGTTIAPRSLNLLWLFDERTRILFETMFGTVSKILEIFYYGSLVALFFWVRRNVKSTILLVWLVIGVFGIGFYRGQILEHYYGYLFPLPFVLLGLAGDWLLKIKWGFIPLIIGLFILSFFEINGLYFWHKPNNLLIQTKGVDKIVLDLAEGGPYNFALIAPGNSDQAYRYFLEIGNRKPIVIDSPQSDPERKSVTNQLIVVCEAACAPLGNPQWEVAGFGRAEIVTSKVGPAGIKIFKLLHYKGG